MKLFRLTMIFALVAALFTGCNEEMNENSTLKKATLPSGTYTETVENVSTPYDYFEAGAKFIPDGAEAAGPAFPGHSLPFGSMPAQTTCCLLQPCMVLSNERILCNRTRRDQCVPRRCSRCRDRT